MLHPGIEPKLRNSGRHFVIQSPEQLLNSNGAGQHACEDSWILGDVVACCSALHELEVASLPLRPFCGSQTCRHGKGLCSCLSFRLFRCLSCRELCQIPDREHSLANRVDVPGRYVAKLHHLPATAAAKAAGHSSSAHGSSLHIRV